MWCLLATTLAASKATGASTARAAGPPHDDNVNCNASLRDFRSFGEAQYSSAVRYFQIKRMKPDMTPAMDHNSLFQRQTEHGRHARQSV